MAERVGTTIKMPHITSRQQHRSSAEASSPCVQRNVAIPFLDHVIMCINEQFSPSAIVATSLLGLVPSILCSKKVNLEAAIKKYEADLPSPELFQMELKRWKNRYLPMPPSKRPASPATAIKDCDQAMFSNISVLLQIACTIPVTSCECERSASVLRQLNSYMRASMGKSRLSHLALLHIHYDTFVDLDKVVMLSFILVDLNWNPFCADFLGSCLMKFVLCMLLSITFIESMSIYLISCSTNEKKNPPTPISAYGPDKGTPYGFQCLPQGFLTYWDISVPSCKFYNVNYHLS